MKRPALLHFLLVLIGFGLAVAISCFVYTALLSLPFFFRATHGWVTIIWDDPLSAFGTLFAVNAIAVFPGWFIAMFIGELALIRSKYFYALVGAASALLAHLIFNSAFSASSDLAFLIPSMISGLCGGLTYWGFIGKQAGAWMPNRRTDL